MKTDFLGNPRAENRAEVSQIVEDGGLDCSTFFAEIYPPLETESTGWIADVRMSDGDDVFSVEGFETRENLAAALEEVGIPAVFFCRFEDGGGLR